MIRNQETAQTFGSPPLMVVFLTPTQRALTPSLSHGAREPQHASLFLKGTARCAKTGISHSHFGTILRQCHPPAESILSIFFRFLIHRVCLSFVFIGHTHQTPHVDQFILLIITQSFIISYLFQRHIFAKFWIKESQYKTITFICIVFSCKSL